MPRNEQKQNRDQFAEYWDALVSRESDLVIAELGGQLDPGLIAVVDRVRKAGRFPEANPVFLKSLEESLVGTFGISSLQAPGAKLDPLPLRNNRMTQRSVAASTSTVGWLKPPRLVRLALAAALAVALLGGAFVYYSRSDNLDEPRAIPAAVSPATPTPTLQGAATRFVWQTAGGPEPLGSAEQITVAPDGNLWVVDGPSSRFQIFSPDGEFIEYWGAPGAADGNFNFTVEHRWGAIAFDTAGNFYVADNGNQRIQKFDAERSFVLAWHLEGAELSQMAFDLAVGEDGRVYAADVWEERIQVFDANGEVLFQFDTEDETGTPFYPGGITTGPDNHLYVTGPELGRVYEYDTDGGMVQSIGKLGAGPGRMMSPYDVAVDDAGRIYVADLGNNDIEVFSASGSSLAELGDRGDGEGQFQSAHSVAVDREGGIYASDSLLKRIQKFQFSPPPEAR